MNWEQCINTGIAKKISIDQELIKSLIISSNDNLNTEEIIPLSESTASPKAGLMYDSVREILEILGIEKGYKIYNHECYTCFIKEVLKDSQSAEIFDRIRKTRNGIKYYGKRLTIEEAKFAITELKYLRQKFISISDYNPKMTNIIIISALAENRVIGNNNTIPWHIPEDFKLFKKYTQGNVIIYGRKTFESLGSKTLPNRHNIVVTRNKIEGIECYPSLKEAMDSGKKYGKDIFLCGGARIYEEGLKFANKLYLSHVKGKYKGDTKFPEFSEKEWKISREEEFENFTFKAYEKVQQL